VYRANQQENPVGYRFYQFIKTSLAMRGQTDQNVKANAKLPPKFGLVSRLIQMLVNLCSLVTMLWDNGQN